MLFDFLPIRAGHTVTHPAFERENLPAHAVIIEVWPATATALEMAELDNGLAMPLTELAWVETGERWIPIPDYSWYRISSHGKIVSLSYKNTGRQRLLKHSSMRYPEVRISNEVGFTHIGVNRLMAQAFLPSPTGLHHPVVIPIDGNRFNLRADNLRWAGYCDVTDPTGWQYLHACQTRKHAKKLSEADKVSIQELARQGLTKQAISQLFGVSRPTISIFLSKLAGSKG